MVFKCGMVGGRGNGAALDLPGSLIARTRSKCKLGHHFPSNVNM